MAVKTKCITITEEQDKKIKTIQIRRMSADPSKTISYSSVLHEIIDKGLEGMV
jgi:hypothetical protein